MVKSVENGMTLAPFLVKCYEMVSDESTNELISWSESNDSFIIWDESRFSSHLLPKYFKHSNFSSFVRQLNIYGFKKIDTDHWQFANEDFIKGQKHLLKNIIRRKQPQNSVQKQSPQDIETDPTPQSEENKTIALWKEVETLKTDKIALTQELKNLSQHQQISQSKMLLLREQLKGMEKNQQQMLSFIVMAMQRPEFMIQFFQPKEKKNWRVAETNGKTKLSEVIDDCEPINPSEGTIVRYQPPKDAHLLPPEASKADDLMEFDFSSEQIRDLLMDFDLLLGPVDEKLLPLENHGEFVLPDMAEGVNLLDQLLLPYPTVETEPELEGEGFTNSGVQMGPTLQQKDSEEYDGSADDVDEDQNCITKASNFRSSDNACERVEDLTEKMEFLTSE